MRCALGRPCRARRSSGVDWPKWGRRPLGRWNGRRARRLAGRLATVEHQCASALDRALLRSILEDVSRALRQHIDRARRPTTESRPRERACPTPQRPAQERGLQAMLVKRTLSSWTHHQRQPGRLLQLRLRRHACRTLPSLGRVVQPRVQGAAGRTRQRNQRPRTRRARLYRDLTAPPWPEPQPATRCRTTRSWPWSLRA
jgi:hypothetical protein